MIKALKHDCEAIEAKVHPVEINAITSSRALRHLSIVMLNHESDAKCRVLNVH
jgi:hypothetical protein